jgi:hypothetical protein
METYFELIERVINSYKVIYDENKLKEKGYKSLKDYCIETNQTPFDAEDNEDEIVQEVIYCGLGGYVDEWEPTRVDSIDWEENK